MQRNCFEIIFIESCQDSTECSHKEFTQLLLMLTQEDHEGILWMTRFQRKEEQQAILAWGSRVWCSRQTRHPMRFNPTQEGSLHLANSILMQEFLHKYKTHLS